MRSGATTHPFPFGSAFPRANSENESSSACHDKAVIHDRHKVKPIVRMAFYLFMATIPFETLDLGIGTEVTVISLGLLLLSVIFQPGLVLKKAPVAYSLFFLYVLIFAIPVYTSTPNIYFEEARWGLLSLIQVFGMSWIAFNIMKSERAARGALLTFISACVLLAVTQQLGITESADLADHSGRVTALGFHPNNIARILGLAMLALAGLVYAIKRSHFKKKLWILPFIGLLGLTIVQTGSRGALLALAAGFLVFVLKEGAASTKLRNTALITIFIIFVVTLVYQSEMNRSRFEEAINEGKLARRETIYPTAWAMFMQHPLFGWGGKNGEYELGARLAHIEEDSKNPHNLILYAMVSTGLVGTIPLVLGLALVTATAWKNRRGIRGVLPLSMVLLVLAANMSGLWITNKMHWFVMAYALSSPFVAKRKKRLLNGYSQAEGKGEAVFRRRVI